MLACHIANFPLVNFTNRASDTFREVMADIKAGYDESIHPKLFELYNDNYHKGLSMFGEPEPGSRYFELHEKFKLNTARLASYKSYKVTKLLKDLPEKDFDKNALQVLKNFNRYQATEYNAIVSRARSAKQFIDFQGDADLYPNMEWIMTRSANPREAHLALVGTIRPINDSFWNENQPGNLWNCKCDWQPTDKEVTGVPKQVVKPATGLDGNPAITGELISDEHPYCAKCNNRAIKNEIEADYDYKLRSLKKFLDYDADWQKELWITDNAGYNVYHKNHQFHPKSGHIEKSIGKELAMMQAKQIEFLPEQGAGISKPDLKFDDKTWDIKWIDDANVTTIRTYIKEARKADNVIFYFSKDKLNELHEAINRTVGHFKKNGQLHELPDIYYYVEKGKIKLLWRK